MHFRLDYQLIEMQRESKPPAKPEVLTAAESRCQWRGLEPTDTSDICKFAPQPQMRRGSFASLVQREVARRMP